MTAHDPDLCRRIQLEREDAARKALGEAIERIDRLDGNPQYRKAWKAAIQSIRRMMTGDIQ